MGNGPDSPEGTLSIIARGYKTEARRCSSASAAHSQPAISSPTAHRLPMAVQWVGVLPLSTGQPWSLIGISPLFMLGDIVSIHRNHAGGQSDDLGDPDGVWIARIVALPLVPRFGRDPRGSSRAGPTTTAVSGTPPPMLYGIYQTDRRCFRPSLRRRITCAAPRDGLDLVASMSMPDCGARHARDYSLRRDTTGASQARSYRSAD